MKVWEAHRDLSLSIGDACNVTETQIPDGVRTTKKLRDSYLYRAMLTILFDEIGKVAQLPRIQQIDYLTKKFPTLKYQTTTTNADYPIVCEDDNNFKFSPLMLYSCFIIDNTTGDPISYALPIKTNPIEVQGLMNARNNQLPDAFCEFFSWIDNSILKHQIVITDRIGQFIPGSPVYITYLPMPENPGGLHKDGSNIKFTDEIIIEPIYISKMISLATLYAMTDNQEIEQLGQYLPLELKEGG